MKFLPKSILGIIGLGISAVFDVLLVFKFLGAVPLPTPSIFGGVLAGFVFSIVAWIRKDRVWSLLVFALPFGLFVSAWSIAEVIWPH